MWLGGFVILIYVIVSGCCEVFETKAGESVVDDNLDDTWLESVGSCSVLMDTGSWLTDMVGWDIGSGPMLGSYMVG